MADSPPPARRRAPRLRRALKRGVGVALALVALAVVALAAAVWTLATQQAGTDWLVRELVARSGGALEIDGAEGALTDTLRVRRIVWHGSTATVSATDVALTWHPASLLTGGIAVAGLGAQRLTLAFEPSESSLTLPDDLALPIDVTIERLGVAQVEWSVGPRRGTIEGLEFGYRGNDSAHRIRNLRLTTEGGTFEGNATVNAHAPFAVDVMLAFAGDAAWREAKGDLKIGGTLARPDVAVEATARGARVRAHASVATLEPVPLREIDAELHDLDLVAWDARLPTTRLALTVRAQPAAGGLEGELSADNALAGSVDAGRAPLRSLAARFAWRADAITLDRLRAELSGGGTATGEARLSLAQGGVGSTVALDVRNVDLRALHGKLVATSLGGRVSGELGAARRTFQGTLVDHGIAGGIALEFRAAATEREVEVERLRARAGGAQLDASGHFGLQGERAFALTATATRLDPSRFGEFPPANIDGKLAAHGVLNPTWQVRAEASLAPTSRLEGHALAGSARGAVVSGGVRDAAIDLRFGAAHLVVSGAYGQVGDRLVATLDAPRIADFDGLLPAAAPRPLAGALNVKVETRGAWPDGSLDATVRAQGLQMGTTYGAKSLSVHAAIDAGTVMANRALALKLDAKDLGVPSTKLASASASVDGSLARHTVAIALHGDDIDLTAKARGALRGLETVETIGWSGSIDALENRGPWAIRLASPAALALAAGHMQLGEARIAVADGSVDIGEFVVDEGRITTRGRIDAVPAATLARLAGRPLPFASTITLGGEWSLAAAPRLSGMVAVRRQSGDLWLAPDATPGGTTPAAGVTALEATVRFEDDAIDAQAMFRATRAGSADATLTVGSVPDAPPGRIAKNAPLALTVRADLATLQPLQPWVGTAAVIDGRARLEITGKGTLASTTLEGALEGDALRVDAPRYGVHYVDGRLRARFAEKRLVLEEFSLTGGAGTFRATGTMTRPPAGSRTPVTQLSWHAERFRIANRPEFNLVVSGDGTVASANGKIEFAGKLRADEGNIVYEPDLNATLASDVVVKGWPQPSEEPRPGADIPFSVDLDLDFGEGLRFSGRGLETGLRGELHVTSGPSGFAAKGSIRAVNGTYFAYGQKLIIDPGRLIFDGPLDNPALDIVALRKNLAVEAGVAVTGTVKVPIVTLTSRPPVPDSEKLSWLVLGHGLESTGGNEVAALQAASAALLGPNEKPVTQTIAERLGLSDISVKSVQNTTTSGGRTTTTQSQVVAVGKQLSDKLSIAYEQGTTIANNALRLEYTLTPSLTLRAEAGVVSGFGLYFRRSFE
jgi:translocation and assembly module TamB